MRARSPKRTVARLAVCQMLLLSNGVLMAAVGSLAGYALAPSPRLAMVPAVTYVLGAAMSTRLTVPFLALTALATSILWFRERRNIGRG